MAEQSDRNFFGRLKKLFSTTAIVRVDSDGKRRVVDVDDRQTNTNLLQLKDRYSKLQRSFYETHAGAQSMAYHQVRRELFREYDSMDNDPIIASALDIYADEATTKNEYGEVLQIKSSNENVKEILENLFYDILNIEFNLWPWTRNLTKYGDFFLGLEIAEGKGVINVIPQSVYYAERLEGYDPNNANSVKFKVEQDRTGKIDWENYEMAHFRLLSDTNFLPYGKSMIESGRRVWKQLCLAADSKIWTDGGYKYISQINIGDVVYSYDYTLNTLVATRVKNHQLTGNKPVYEVKTGHRTIRGTYEHPIMVANGVYKNIGELNTSDYIIVGNHVINTDSKLPKLQVDESLFVAKFNDDFYSTNLLNNKQVYNECGSHFGRLTGNHLKTHNLNVDEYCDRYDIDTDFAGLFYRNTRISYKSAIRYCDVMNISTDNLDIFLNKCNNTIIPESIILEHISLFIRFIGFMLGDGWLEDNTVCFSLGDKLTKSMKYVELMEKLNASYRIRNEGLSKADCVVSSTYLRTLLTDVLEFRTGTFNKILPNWVYELPLELRREFLYGFADADGTPINNGYSVGGVNKAMLESLHTLAQQAGFTTTNFRTGSDTHDNKSIMYGFEFSDSQYHMQTDGNGVLIEKIRSIKVLPPIDVYDIEVDNELHNFISDGVVAHNCLMEDAMLIHRIMRAPEKRVFKIDIGNINPTEVDNYMQKIISKMKKVPFVNKDTGDYNLKYNMQNLTEDFFLPVRGGDSGTSIDNLGGLEYAATEDIEFLQKKLFASLKVPKAYLSYDENLNGKCISPDTMIPLISGEVKSVAQLIDDYNNGILNYVYSLDEKSNNIVSGEIEWAGYTRMNTQIVKVWLDNGKYIECTPDHKFLTRDGNWVEAQHLTNAQSLMPLYLDNGGYKGNYTTVYEPSTDKYKLVHKIVAEQYNILSDGKVVHHIDFNSRNNNPDNLDCHMTFWEHRDYHSKHISKPLNSPTQLKIRNDKFRLNNHFSIIGRLGGIKSGKRLGEWVKEHGPSNKQPDIYKQCEVCGTDYKVHNCRYDIAKVCSRDCYSIYLSDKMKNEVQYNQKYTDISYEYLLSVASKSVSFADLEKRLGITRRTLDKVFDYHNIDKIDFIYENMTMSHGNINFIKNYKKYEPTYKNHKVENVEWVDDTIDTCDLTIKTYHNFGTAAGVIIHNSTLAAEDVRFARTIERIQRTIVSELTKIAIVHLAAQGIDDSEMVNFELTLTNASTIYEQEKVNLWSEKVRLATDMAGLKMLSKDWVYSNVFAMSDADKDTEKVRIISDLKDAFRHTSIETDGNDPAEQPEPTDIEGELEELKKEIGNRKSGGVGGRPREGNTYGKDKHPYGRDPLGDGENHKERRRETTSTTNNKKLAREYINGMSAKKKIIVEKRDFLDETNLLDDSKIQ